MGKAGQVLTCAFFCHKADLTHDVLVTFVFQVVEMPTLVLFYNEFGN